MPDDEKGYNGWTNYETWLLALNLDNDQATQEMIVDWAREHPLKDYEYEHNRADDFKDFLEDAFWVEEYNIIHICDSWTTRDFAEVNFQEVLKHFEEQ